MTTIQRGHGETAEDAFMASRVDDALAAEGHRHGLVVVQLHRGRSRFPGSTK